MKRACGSSDYWKETKSLAYLIQELFVIQTIGHISVARQNQTLILGNSGTQSHCSNLLKTNVFKTACTRLTKCMDKSVSFSKGRISLHSSLEGEHGSNFAGCPPEGESSRSAEHSVLTATSKPWFHHQKNSCHL